MKEAARTSCSTETVASTSADPQEYVGRIATDFSNLPTSAYSSVGGSSAKVIDDSSRSAQYTVHSRESTRMTTSARFSRTSRDELHIKMAPRRGASGAPANNQPIGVTGSTRDTLSSSRDQQGFRLAFDLEDEDEYDSKRPHVPLLTLHPIIKMREMFEDLDLKHDYRCDTPPSTSGSSASECDEADLGVQLPCSDFFEKQIDFVRKPSGSLERLRAARESVLRRYEEKHINAQPHSWLCRLLGVVVPGGDCSQEDVREANEGLYRVSSV